MKTETKILGGILILTLVLLVGGIFLLSRGGSESANTTKQASVQQIDYSKGQKIGSDSAKVKLVEFSDFQCPACAAAEPYLTKIRSIYPNEVQLIYRHFPLPQHDYAKKTAYMAEAAGVQGKFWEMHDKIFETQTQWSKLSDSEATIFFENITRQLELNEDEVKKALEDDTFRAKFEEDLAEGKRLGVNSTPTFFLNGQKLNLQNFNNLITVVEEELKK